MSPFVGGRACRIVRRLSGGVVALWFCLSVVSGCAGQDGGVSAELPTELFRDGDLAFRRGTGWTSRVVLAADKSGAYSHVGILKRVGGRWCVVHAVPGEPDFRGDPDRVKLDDVATFFARGRAANGAVMRVEDAPEAARRAAESALRLFRAGVLFDHDYDLADTTRMYCTELVDYVYRSAGVDLPEGRLSQIHIPLFDGDYLLPNDIVQSPRLRLIYMF